MRSNRGFLCLAVALCAGLALRPSAARGDEPTATPPTPPAAPPSAVTVNAPATAPAPTTTVITQPAANGAGPQVLPTEGTTKETVLAPSADTGRFEFGSYGRVRFASDLRGGTGRQANVVSHGSRLDEESYAELELRREDDFKDGIHTKVVSTLALFPPFFHFSGDPSQQIAVRNLYAQATYDKYTMWVGSRMYRGDDIYLLDWWPLDNQNTLGGGAGVKLPTAGGDTLVAAHVGMQRLDNPYQYQTIPAVAPFGFGATNVIHLDRPRVVETLKVTKFLRTSPDAKPGFKVILYGEAHELAAGVQRDPLTNQDKPLPSDAGLVVGTELAYWTGERDTFVQLFLRHARGIAAYDPLAVPLTFANDKTTSGSTETLIALGGNYEKDFFGVLVGAYLRFFRDGDPSVTSTQKYDEGIVVARPQLYIGEHWGIALEGSYQMRRFAWLDPATNAPLSASVLRGGIIPYFSPSGRGSYKRPQLRILYTVTARDAGARSLYAAEDPFAQRKVEHFLGLGAEWWFNSSSYP